MAHQMPQIKGVKHHFVSAGDISFHVAEAGPKDGPPVLLVHGWPQHWYAWRHVIPRLAETRHVYAMDLRGFGWTDIAWTGFEKESLADDVVNLLGALEIERVQYVGHDWGAWIGYLLAMRRPDLLSGLVALSVPPPFVKPSLRTIPALARFRYQLVLASPFAVRVLRNPRYVKSKTKSWAKVKDHIDRDDRRIYGRDLRASTRARASMLMYRTFLARELGPALAGRYRKQRIEVPTKILHGVKDPILPPSLYRGLEPYFSDLEVEALARSGHLLPEERPDEVAAAVLEMAPGAEPAPAPA